MVYQILWRLVLIPWSLRVWNYKHKNYPSTSLARFSTKLCLLCVWNNISSIERQPISTYLLTILLKVFQKNLLCVKVSCGVCVLSERHLWSTVVVLYPTLYCLCWFCWDDAQHTAILGTSPLPSNFPHLCNTFTALAMLCLFHSSLQRNMDPKI